MIIKGNNIKLSAKDIKVVDDDLLGTVVYTVDNCENTIASVTRKGKTNYYVNDNKTDVAYKITLTDDEKEILNSVVA